MGKLEKSSQARVDAAEAAIEAVKKEIELLEKMEKLNRWTIFCLKIKFKEKLEHLVLKMEK